MGEPTFEGASKATPTKAPSGKKAHGYGEIMIRVWATGPEDDPWKGAEAVILTPPGLPFPFYMVGAEHLMTAVAQKSDAGFERALELLVEGATTNRGKIKKERGG